MSPVVTTLVILWAVTPLCDTPSCRTPSFAPVYATCIPFFVFDAILSSKPQLIYLSHSAQSTIIIESQSCCMFRKSRARGGKEVAFALQYCSGCMYTTVLWIYIITSLTYSNIEHLRSSHFFVLTHSRPSSLSLSAAYIVL
jgi:hypothetical protein